MAAQVHRLLPASLGFGFVVAALGCSFEAPGLGEGGAERTSGVDASTGSGGATSAGQSSGGALPTEGEGGQTEASGGGSSGAPVEPGTGTSTGTTVSEDTTTSTTSTSGEDMTSTGVESSTGPACVDPQPFYLDSDMDGYGDPTKVVVACEAPAGHVSNSTDCDDGRAEVNPGAQEVCDGRDTDCDGLVDEYNPPHNVDCGGCKMFARDMMLYHFCDVGKNWNDAQAQCVSRKAVLAKDGDEAVHHWLMDRMTDIQAKSGGWWLGGRRNDGGLTNFKWRDGAALGGFQPWAQYFPSALIATDCISVDSPASGQTAKQWKDWYCSTDRPLICEGPLPP